MCLNIIDSITTSKVDSFKYENEAGDEYGKCQYNATDGAPMGYNNKDAVEQLPNPFRRGGKFQ